MQKVSSVFAYVVNEGRVCALKPSEWSILLAGVSTLWCRHDGSAARARLAASHRCPFLPTDL